MPIHSNQNQICERCHQNTITRIMSMFNMDMICPQCKKEETHHPLYKLACLKEREALERGERNFPGIGWPPVNEPEEANS